jgi:osmotically inducible lipoprotein OsmB
MARPAQAGQENHGVLMRKLTTAGTLTLALLLASACSSMTRQEQRALSGGAIGAAGGAAVGALTGGSLLTGALIGGAGGAAVGALTGKNGK